MTSSLAGGDDDRSRRSIETTSGDSASGAMTTEVDAPIAASVLTNVVPLEALLDGVGIALAVVLAASVVFDLELSVRWPVAIAFFAWVPGWTVVRLAGFGAGALSLLASVGLSLALASLVGETLVVIDWGATRAVNVAICASVAVALGRDLRKGLA